MKTKGVQTPAEMRRRVQGRVVFMPVWVFWIRMLVRVLEVLRVRERARVGWWRWTPRERQAWRRNLQRRRGSLFRCQYFLWEWNW